MGLSTEASIISLTKVESSKDKTDFSSVGPSSEQMEELWVAIAYKREDRATLLAETCRDVKGNKKEIELKR